MKLLYITFIDLYELPTTGSSVRPQKINRAFEELNIEIETIDGINNNFSKRKKAVAQAKELLKTWKPDMCYIEPPSGPMFYHGDVRLIKLLHKKKIPTAIFYRDAYWKYPEYAQEKKQSTIEWIKHSIIRGMQIYQWNIFRKNIDIIYFPSVTMAKEFDCLHKDILPPGGFVPEAKEKKELSEPLQFIFVGGAARNYGTFLTIESFEKLNEDGIKAKLIYVCPEEQWKGLGIDGEKYKEWLEVVHTSGDNNLQPYYERADVALLTAPRTFYRDFAVPIKIFEYMSYLKPILVTNCTETARIVRENQMGWICKDNVASIVESLQYLCSCPKAIMQIRDQMKEVRDNNLWVSRAKKVITDLGKSQL